MDAKRIHDDITHLLYKVEEQYSRILQSENSIPMMDIDLALKDIRDLYEAMLDLRTLAEIQRRKGQDSAAPKAEVTPVVEAPKVVEVEVKEETPVAEEILPEIVEEAAPVVLEVKEEEKAEVIELPIPEVKAEVKVEEKAPEPKAVSKTEKKAVEEKAPEASPIAWQKTFDASQVREEAKAAAAVAETPAAVVTPKVDLLQERQKDFVPTVRKIEFKPEPVASEPKKESIFEKAASLYDKIAKPAEKTVASQATRQPISNIKSSIGINEKFAYLKDLFKNNVNEYNEALDKLNNFENYGDAEDYFQELKAKNGWDPESKSFQGLADLLNRRYLHNA